MAASEEKKECLLAPGPLAHTQLSVCGAIMLNKHKRMRRSEAVFFSLCFHSIFAQPGVRADHYEFANVRCDNCTNNSIVPQWKGSADCRLLGIWIKFHNFATEFGVTCNICDHSAWHFATFSTPSETLLCKSGAVNSNESNKNNNWSDADAVWMSGKYPCKIIAAQASLRQPRRGFWECIVALWMLRSRCEIWNQIIAHELCKFSHKCLRFV